MTPNSATSMFRDSLRRATAALDDGAVRVPLLGRERGDVDDHPGALRPERGQERLDQRRDAEDVGLVLPVDLLHARALERSHLVIAGVVHQGIHPAELLEGEPGEGHRRCLIIDIQQRGLHAAETGVGFEV
jgi:hypothetical protein